MLFQKSTFDLIKCFDKLLVCLIPYYVTFSEKMKKKKLESPHPMARMPMASVTMARVPTASVTVELMCTADCTLSLQDA